MLSFIVPIRGRDKRPLLRNLRTVYRHLNYEVILAEQTGGDLFCRGQLLNLGVKKASSEIVVLHDEDIRHFEPIDFAAELQRHGPFVAFDRITDVREHPDGVLETIRTTERLKGFGACTVLTRQQFEDSGGFSNLLRGWGAEDCVLAGRVKMVRLPYELGHVEHDRPWADMRPEDRPPWYQRNKRLWLSDRERDPARDGWRQTTARKEMCIAVGRAPGVQTYHWQFTGIGVTPGFSYQDLLL